MFTGKFYHTLDDKGRLIMPASFRKDLEIEGISTVWVTYGLGNCLSVYPPSQFEEILNKIEAMPGTKKEVRDFTRKLCSEAVRCNLDEQGRITLPESLRQLAGLKKDVIVIGVIRRVEIWAEELWSEYDQEITRDFEKNAEAIIG